MKTLQLPRGTTGQNDAYTGAAGQETVDTTRWEIRLHDGETPGGFRILNLTQLLEVFMSKDSEFGNVAFAPADRGFLVRIGDREYALRGLDAGDGVTIEDGLGEVGNPTIGLDADYITNLFLNTSAGKLLYAGETTGTADALILETDVDWANAEGNAIVFKFHLTPADAVTLNVNNGGAFPLLTANGAALTSLVAPIGTIGFAIRIGNNYYLLGLQAPKEIGLTAIEGLDATNMQDAIAELLARIVELEGGATDPGGALTEYTYANIASKGNNGAMPLADGESRLIFMWKRASLQSTDPFASTTEILYVNGVPIAGVTVGENDSVDMGMLGIVYREGNAIYFTQISDTIIANSTGITVPTPTTFGLTNDSKFILSPKKRCGSVATADTTVTLSSSGVSQSTHYWSDVGVVA